MRVAIAGAGAVGRSIAKELLENGHEVLLIDKNSKAIKVYSVPRAEWLLADACEIASLDDASLERCNVVIAATGDDKVNLVVSLLAKTEYGVPRVVARINHPNNEWLFNESWGVDVAVSTPRMLSALVEEAVSVGDLVRLMTFRQSAASLVELTMPDDAPLVGQRIGAIEWPADTALVAILRDGRVIVPNSDDPLEAGDELLFVTSEDVEAELGLLLRRLALSYGSAEVGATGLAALPGLADLRAPGERIRQVPALLFLRELLLQGLPGLLGQPDLQLLARRCRVVAAYHDDVAEQLVERGAGGRPGRGRAADHAAQEPARTVEAQEPDRLRLPGQGRIVLGPDRDARVQLGAGRPRRLRRSFRLTRRCWRRSRA